MSLDPLVFPLAALNKAIRFGLPASVPAISSEIRNIVGRYTAVFLIYLINTANSRRIEQGSVVLSIQDIFWALNHIGMGDFIPELRIYLNIFRNSQRDRRRATRISMGGTNGEFEEGEFDENGEVFEGSDGENVPFEENDEEYDDQQDVQHVNKKLRVE
jgi:hypothetical protein